MMVLNFMLPMETPQDEQLAEILGMQQWYGIVVILSISIVILYVLLFFIRRSLLRSINGNIHNTFKKSRGIRLTRSSNGIYQVFGRYRDRTLRIQDKNSVWIHPRIVIISISHNIAGVLEKNELNDFTISVRYARKVLSRWPTDLKPEIDRMINEIIDLENNGIPT